MPDDLEHALPTRSAAYGWKGLTLIHSTTRTGVDLSPEWALVRVRRYLEQHNGDTSGRPSSARLEFSERIPTIAIRTGRGPSLPIAGAVRAAGVPGGVVVTASASLAPLLWNTAFAAAAILAGAGDLIRIQLSELVVGLALLSIVFTAWSTARALKQLTTAGTTL